MTCGLALLLCLSVIAKPVGAPCAVAIGSETALLCSLIRKYVWFSFRLSWKGNSAMMTAQRTINQ